jgi:dihydrolipoamide dehydrogenase
LIDPPHKETIQERSRNMKEFDVVVIGGGPGGYVCAIRAAQLGLNVAVVDKDNSELGGTCLTKGCIPTKSILQSAHLLRNIRNSEDFGITADLREVSLAKIIARSKGIISGLNRGVNGLMSKNKITFLKGTAKFQKKDVLLVDNEEVHAKNVVIATGAKPRVLPGLESLIEKNLIWTSKEAINPKFLPRKLLVIGSGAIGVELASFYNALGSEIVISEIMDHILIQEDREISDAAAKSFQKQGIRILTAAKTSNFRENAGKVLVDIEKDGNIETQEFDAVLLSIGVVPNTSELNLDKVGVETNERGIILVKDFQETSVPGIYAIGDVVQAPWLAHKASREGIIAAERIAGLKNISPIDLSKIPACTYSYPQIASIGMSEQKAKESGQEIRVGRAYFRGNGRALAAGEPDGFIKLIFNKSTGEILGAHMIGNEVTELLSLFSVAIAGELVDQDLLNAVFPHPTISEVIQEAVLDAFSRGINS